MLPRSIAILALYFGAIAAVSSAKLLRILQGAEAGAAVWQVVWLGLSSGAVYGLAMLKPWGRRLAVWTAALLMAFLLALSAMLVLVARETKTGFALACAAALQMLVVRYLGRASVKRLFGAGASDAGSPGVTRPGAS